MIKQKSPAGATVWEGPFFCELRTERSWDMRLVGEQGEGGETEILGR